MLLVGMGMLANVGMTTRIPPVLDLQPPLIAPPPIIPRRPGVVLATRFWCGFIGVLHLLVVVFSVLELTGVIEPSTGLIEELTTPKTGPARDALMAEKRQEFREIAPLMITGSVIGMGFYGFAFFVPRRKWAWNVGLIAIIASLFPFCVTWTGMIPLLILWCKPEVKAYFSAVEFRK
jgi:hypothetical protein